MFIDTAWQGVQQIEDQLVKKMLWQEVVHNQSLDPWHTTFVKLLD